MRQIETPIEGVHLLETERRADERGYFARCYCQEELRSFGIEAEITQANLSHSRTKATLRGLHYQQSPRSETKIVQCLNGRIHDLVLDIRPGSGTFGRWFAAELSSANGRIMVVPEGCAHGFLTLEPNCLVHYMVTAPYTPDLERGIRYDDRAFAIPWPLEPAILSERDRSHPDFDLRRHLAK